MTQWDLFVSYSRDDSVFVEACVEALEADGLQVWMDTRPRPRELTRLPVFITHGLLESPLLCLFLSARSLDSSWVQQEFHAFVKKLWGFWDDLAQPVILVLALPGTTYGLEELLAPPWGPDIEREVGVAQVELRGHRDDLQIVVAETRDALDAVETLRSEIPARGRLEQAKRFFDFNKPIGLRAWDSSNLEWALKQFDCLEPPYDRWSERTRARSDEEIEEALDEVLATGVHGTNFAVLFAEAIAAEVGNRYASVSAREDLESKYVLGKEYSVTATTTGSPVNMLCNVAIDNNIASEIQHGYYYCRSRPIGVATKDALDLTVLLALGFVLDRWWEVDIGVGRVVEVLTGQEEPY